MRLRADDLSLRLGGADILCGISAAFEPGTITAICGPNGAGKSTLLACLGGLTVPNSGAASMAAEAVLSLSRQERARRIGYLPQYGEVAWDLSVSGLVALGRLPHGDDQQQGRGGAAIDQAISSCGLEPLADRPISTLSGGERARALLARVLAGEPHWILADEPLAALDLAHQLSLLEQLRDAAAGGAGVVLVLHDLPLAMNHADQVVVLDRGRVAAAGPPELALSEDSIARVWGVRARWLGEPGARALAIR